MNTLGGVSLEVVVQQPLCSTLAEQKPNLSFTGKENKQDPPMNEGASQKGNLCLCKRAMTISNFLPGDAYKTHERMMLSTTSGSPAKFKIID